MSDRTLDPTALVAWMRPADEPREPTLPTPERFEAWTRRIVHPPTASAAVVTVLRQELAMACITYRRALAPRPSPDRGLMARFEAAAHRPAVRVDLDQQPVDSESAVRRALAIAEAVPDGPVLFVGDDDLCSVALAIHRPDRHILVLDIDPRVIEAVEAAADPIALPHLVARRRNVLYGCPTDLLGTFAAAVTDPPRSLRGAAPFVRLAALALEPGPKARLFLADHPSWNPEHDGLMSMLRLLGFECRRVLPELHCYPIPPAPAAEIDAFTAALGLDPDWVPGLLRWSRDWSHLHILGRVRGAGRSSVEIVQTAE
jgi:hypothetical protein